MTDPNNDELGEALRHELRSTYVNYDEARADEMISSATESHLLDARRWNAPLAAAAAVVLVGGGGAIAAASIGHWHQRNDAAPAAGGGPYVAVCGTAGPIPSASPASSATPSPVTPSRSSAAVPSVSPTVVFPVVVSPTIAVPRSTATPSSVAPPVPSASAQGTAESVAPEPSATDPCATPSPVAAPATSSAPAPAPVASASAAPSESPSATRPTVQVPPARSTSPAYEPPIPPTPTESGQTNAVPISIEVTADPGGTAGTSGPVIAADRKFVVTSLIFRNTVPASAGSVTLTRGGDDLLSENLSDFRTLDHHFANEPIVFTGDDGAGLTMNCTGTAACDASVLLIGNYVPR